MSNLDDIKNLLAQGDKEEAIKMLASSLRLNGSDIEAWLLLGEVIDDPAKKKDCYNQVLKLSPNNPLALNGLESLTLSNSALAKKSTADMQDTQPREVIAKEPVQDLRENSQHQQSSKSAQSSNGSKDDWKSVVIAIVITILGISGFLGVSYVLGLILTIGDSSSDSDPLCMGMTLIGLIAGAFIWYSNGKNRSEVAKSAIQEQKQQISSSSSYSSKSNVISCRVCQHPVSRTAPSCPNCGELYPGLISKCPYCGSKNIHVTPKGFSLGKAAAGAVIAGPLGAAGGLYGRKDLEVKCASCHRTLTIKHDEI